MLALDCLHTPEDVVKAFAARGIIIKERTLRETARAHGACRRLGKALFFTDADIERLLTALAPAPQTEGSEPCGSTSAELSGIIHSPSTGKDTANLRKRLTSGSRQTSPTSTKPGSAVLPFTGRKRS